MRKRHRTRYPGIYYRLEDESKPDGGRRYIVWYSDENAVGHTQTLPLEATLEDARLLQGQLQTRKSQGESLVRSRMTVAELLRKHLEDRRDTMVETSVESWEWAIEKHLIPAFGSRKIQDLSPSEVARFIAGLKKKGLKTWTVRKIETPLRGAYRSAVRDGLVSSSPMDKLLPHERPKGDQKEMRCLSRAEIQTLLDATPTKLWKTLFALLVFSGLRISEALALTWEDVGANSVTIRKGKTEAAARETLIIPDVRRLLTELKLEQAPGAQLVFSTHDGAPVGRREALRALHSIEKRAGLPAYTLHELRHTFASILIAQRELPTFVAKQMGHADPSVTMKVYAKLWEAQESTDSAREKLQAAMGGIV